MVAPVMDVLKPLCGGWTGKVEEAKRLRKPWEDTAQECWQFFCGATGFMWEDKFQSKFMKGKLSPRFRMTMAKAFELVALFGPILYWRNPQRVIRPRKRTDLHPAFFGDPEDPNVDGMFQAAMRDREIEMVRDKARAGLLESYLNYTPGEQPYGGLAGASEKAITEALVKGRGCLWTDTFSLPGSGRTLTGSFWDSPDNLFIDPDAECLEDAKWIAQRCVKPVWEVELEYDLPKGSLNLHASIESAGGYGESQGNDLNSLHRAQGLTYDHICYYKIWSKGGVGSRLSGTSTPLSDHFDDVVGDYAFVVVSPTVPYPLNAPTEKFLKANDDEVSSMFRWPIPFWLDGRWPVTCLDFYEKPRSSWPIAPMAPGLGELIFINVMISHLCNRIWSSSRDFICILERARNEIESKIRSGDDLCIIGLSETNKNINEVVQFLQQPNVSMDAWNIIDRMLEIFDKRTGLSELLYGLNPQGTQERTATGAATKREMVSVRPDYMAGKVEDWQEEVARKENIALYFSGVSGNDLDPLFDAAERSLWDQFVTNEDPEVFVRDMRATISAGSARKPNKERDAQNINTMAPSLVAELSKHADVTGDTNPINSFIDTWGSAIDQDVSGLKMGPRTPQEMSPEQQQMMQQQMEMETQKLSAELQKKQLEAQIKQIDLQIKAMEAQGTGAEVEDDMLRSQLELETEQARGDQQLQFNQDEHEQNMLFDRQTHLQELFQQRQTAALKMNQMEQEGAVRVQQAKAMAKAKPKPSSNGKSKSGSKK